MGDSWSMTLWTNSCDCDLVKAGLIGVLSIIGVGADPVAGADARAEESGVGGNSVISLSVTLRRRSDCLLFWNQIFTAFSVMLTRLEMSVRLTLFGVEPTSNSRFKMANSWGEVLLLLRRANEALSMEGSCDGYVAGE